MFKHHVNTMCNNMMFTSRRIAAMAKTEQESGEQHPLIGRFLQAAANHGDTTTAQIARRLNVSIQVAQNWTTRGISKEGALAAQAAYGCDANWLLGVSDKPRQLGARATDEDWSDILGVRQAAALGDGAEPDEYAETHKLKFRSASLARKKLKPEHLAVIYGKGDSMYPTIKDGDAILIDTGDKEPKDDKLFVITYGRDLIAKRLVNLGGRWFIDSDNKADPKWKRPQAVDETKGFEIHGRVRWIGSWED